MWLFEVVLALDLVLVVVEEEFYIGLGFVAVSARVSVLLLSQGSLWSWSEYSQLRLRMPILFPSKELLPFLRNKQSFLHRLNKRFLLPLLLRIPHYMSNIILQPFHFSFLTTEGKVFKNVVSESRLFFLQIHLFHEFDLHLL